MGGGIGETSSHPGQVLLSPALQLPGDPPASRQHQASYARKWLITHKMLSSREHHPFIHSGFPGAWGVRELPVLLLPSPD